MRLKISFALLFVLIINSALAVTKYYFFVQFKNKANTSYSLSAPSAYLSQRAIDRRATFNIAIDSTDLPVNEQYVSTISNLGFKIHCRSKWMNGITVLVQDSSTMYTVRNLSFVKLAQYTGKRDVAQTIGARKSKFATASGEYGSAATQLNMMNANYLHSRGYTGKNIHVGVLDAGFSNVNINVGFDSLRLQGRLLGTKDFTEETPNIYGSDAHGANVLSIMTGNKPGQYLGAAPHASFWLIRTEYGPTEYLCETDFWVSGLEFADSVGVDIINSSLGYTTFDDAILNYTYSNMNGSFSRASRAATMASQKGILVCNSAGNDGNKTWHYIGVPADAPGIITVGAADNTINPSIFTSFGPSSDNRQKPELSAMGTATAYINTSGTVQTGNGTSYSSPLMAGMFACFLQYAKTNIQNYSINSLKQSAIQSAHLYNAPNYQLGYGVPNFQTACGFLPANVKLPFSNSEIDIFYSKGSELIVINLPTETDYSIKLYDMSGKIVFTGINDGRQLIIPTNNIKNGAYIADILSSTMRFKKKIIVY